MIAKNHPTNPFLWAELMEGLKENLVEFVTNIVRDRERMEDQLNWIQTL